MYNTMDMQLIKFQSHGDERGSLVAIEHGKEIPFDVKRIYYLYDTKTDVARGFHAHKKLKQILIAVNGSCTIILDDGKERKSVKLTNPDEGLFIDSFVWREMHDFSEDCTLLVLANSHYDEADYIRSYDKFLEMAKS
ncbi:FdtA/QdtA family cupin domain-containing protein [Paraglaciecola aquimarina]|uniref:FdtA/QdtA family cupin domain-containing protein n=1 Tax=Paraglaciecola aquimarina TaxID=1235557 RepID=A0ABU3T289_9ALTE|nr:FdtA/QdtA family cupin domain-containing protein [Paraglaciecola aquimarina]MDU0356370.1 FdtA/QdtA family cupin domain-containing protein [Paraglaciecola aquimarina]